MTRLELLRHAADELMRAYAWSSMLSRDAFSATQQAMREWEEAEDAYMAARDAATAYEEANHREAR